MTNAHSENISTHFEITHTSLSSGIGTQDPKLSLFAKLVSREASAYITSLDCTRRIRWLPKNLSIKNVRSN